jgi:hypothetical protein
MLLKHVRKNNRLIISVSLRDDECGILSQPLRFIQATASASFGERLYFLLGVLCVKRIQKAMAALRLILYKRF